jgi:hypothetical protein
METAEQAFRHLKPVLQERIHDKPARQTLTQFYYMLFNYSLGKETLILQRRPSATSSTHLHFRLSRRNQIRTNIFMSAMNKHESQRHIQDNKDMFLYLPF